MSRVIQEPPILAALLSSVFFVAGCGDQPKAAEQPNKSSKTVEATAPAGKNGEPASGAASTQPSTPAAAAEAAPPFAPAVLEDVRQFAEVLDLGKLPMPTGGTLGEASPTRFHATVPLKVKAAVDFYRKKLEAEGWKPAGPNSMESVTDSFAQVQLGKGNYLIGMTILPAGDKLAGVEIEQRGDLDSRTFPRLGDVTDIYSDHGSTQYFTTVKLDKAVEELRKRLKAEGWQEYDKAFTQKADRHDAADLLFLKKAYTLHVSVMIPPAEPGKTSVTFAISTLARDMPSPTDAAHIEIEDSRWIMMCETPGETATAADYYRKAMKELGFTTPPRESSSDKWRTLSFESADKDLVVVTLQPAKDKGTKVKLEGFTAAFLEAVDKARDAARQKHEAEEKADAADKAARAKKFREESERQDKIMNDAIGSAVKSATQSAASGDSKKIEDDVKSKMEKALHDAGLGDAPAPAAKPAK
jgi:hypothetical protein